MANNAKTPTLKQKMFAKKYIEYKGNASKAALEAYNVKPKNSAHVGYIELQKEGTQIAIKELLNKNGLDLETLTSYGSKAIQDNLTNGKPSQAVGADLLKFYYKVHNVIPKDSKQVIKQERKVLVSQDFNVLKQELTTSVSTTQALLQDL